MGGGHKFTDNLPCLASYWVQAKKKTYGYRERDEAKRQAFLEQLATIDPDNIVYADAAGMDNQDDYGYGWNEQGERFHAAVVCGGIIPPQTNLLKAGQRQGRVNMIAAYCHRQLFAAFTIVGARNIG